MDKTRQFGCVRHTGGSDDGEEESVVESVRQHGREDALAVENDDCQVVEDEPDAHFENKIEENGICVQEEVVGDLRDKFRDVVRDDIDLILMVLKAPKPT
ncbi:hypothetical protein Bca4012_038633 [Brassica carinata]